MSKQSDIRVGLGKLQLSKRPHGGENYPSFLSPDDIEIILQYLTQNQVAIRVDRELPKSTHSVEEYSAWQSGYWQAQEDMLKANYVAVESLIEER